MKKSEIVQLVLTGISFVGFIGTAIYANTNNMRMRKVSDKLGVAVDHIIDEADIQIPQRIMDTAMEEAVKKAAKNQVNASAISISADIKDDMCRDIRKRVADCTKTMEDDIRNEYRNRVKNLDLDDIRDQVITEVSNKSMKMVKNGIDDIIDRHNEKLDAAVKVYESLEERFDLS